METKFVSARLLSPISISAERQSQFSESLDYIPGSTIRGALAQRYLDLYGKDDFFDEIFINEDSRFSSLLPALLPTQSPRILPLTAMTCKNFPGFSDHGVVDNLWILSAQQSLLNLNSSNPLSPEVFSRQSFCDTSGCGKDRITWTGYWNGDTQNPLYIPVPKIEIMHTGIDRQTGTVAEKILYSVEAIDPFSKVSGSLLYFNGHFRLTEKGWEKLDKTIKQSPILFLGRGKTRGQGEIELHLSLASLGQDNAWEKWSLACGRTLQEITKQNLNGTYFSITLLSDAIMVDKFLRYTTALDLPFAGSQLMLSILKQGFAFGWNQAHRLPKEDEKTISRGSIFLFHYLGQIDEIMGSLLDMQANGIGLRRNEGFGQILINDPFHMIFSGIKEGHP